MPISGAVYRKRPVRCKDETTVLPLKIEVKIANLTPVSFPDDRVDTVFSIYLSRRPVDEKHGGEPTSISSQSPEVLGPANALNTGSEVS